MVDGKVVRITGRDKLSEKDALPPVADGLECIVLIDSRIAATLRFRDEPRPDGWRFISHLGESHHAHRLILLSGDRESEAHHIAGRLGIKIAYGGQSPEQKVEIVRTETLAGPTIFVGDGINDAPAMLAATVGVAFGPNSDVTAEAADAVILDGSLAKVDALIHIGRRMRSIALQCAVGGMTLSFIGMIAAVVGFLPPLAGAAAQEIIDIAAVVNAVRTALPTRNLSDY